MHLSCAKSTGFSGHSVNCRNERVNNFQTPNIRLPKAGTFCI